MHMSTESNKATMRRFYDEVMNNGNLELLSGLLASDFQEHSPLPDQRPGVEGLKEGLSSFRKAFPDLHFEVEDLIAEGDQVVARVSYGGTHQGEFAGFPASGKKFKVMGIDIVSFNAEGKVVGHWSGDDAQLKMMQQLGAIPEGPQAPGGSEPAPYSTGAGSAD